MDKRLKIDSIWLKRDIGKHYQISIPNNYKELNLKEESIIYSDGISKYIVINNVKGQYEDPKVVLYAIWKKMNKEEDKPGVEISYRTKNNDKQYKFEIIIDNRFFAFVLIVGEEEQILVQLSSLEKDKDKFIKEYTGIVNTIKRRGRKKYAN